MRKLLYTVITGNYDEPNPKPNFKDWDYLLITDNPDIDSKGWPIKLIEPSENSVKLQRYWKINSHLLGYDLTCYIDGNMNLKADPIAIFTKYGQSGFVFVQHPERKCFLYEGEKVIELKKDSLSSVRNQVGEYVKDGMPYNMGMMSTGMMLRTDKFQDFESTWWNEVEKYSHRDQLSVMYAIWKTGLKPNTVPWATFTAYVNFKPHLKKKPLRIWYSNPYSVEKNIGKAYNEFCDLVPNEDDWIVMQDGDMMYLRPDFGSVIHDTLQKHGDKYQLFGCLTNRLASTHQLHENTFSNDHDIMNHLQIAKQYDGTEVVDTHGIAGLFMCFQKKTWKKVGGFQENTHTFDSEFSVKVKRKGMKIGIMKGLYVYHQYRPWSNSPRTDVKHLK
jgi:hypothetical protein